MAECARLEEGGGEAWEKFLLCQHGHTEEEGEAAISVNTVKLPDDNLKKMFMEFMSEFLKDMNKKESSNPSTRKLDRAISQNKTYSSPIRSPRYINSNSPPAPKSPNRGVCFNCEKPGHFIADCPTKKKNAGYTPPGSPNKKVSFNTSRTPSPNRGARSDAR